MITTHSIIYGFQSHYMQSWYVIKTFLWKAAYLSSLTGDIFCAFTSSSTVEALSSFKLPWVNIPASLITVISTNVPSMVNNVLRRHWIIYKTKCSVEIRALFFSKSRLSLIPTALTFSLIHPQLFLTMLYQLGFCFSFSEMFTVQNTEQLRRVPAEKTTFKGA